MDIMDYFKLKKFRFIYVVTFVSYFIFFQIATRLLIFTHIKFPPGVSIVISTSPPVPPSQMPFPLWGPFFSITTRYSTWALTPLSIGISFLLSFLVALNVSLYIIYYLNMKMKISHQLLSSLGILATSLSCSCEYFTGLIGSAAANLPFIASITFMERLFEGLVILAVLLLLLSSYVLFSEINGKKVLVSLSGYTNLIVTAIALTISIILPYTPAFSFVKLILSIIAGGFLANAIDKKWRTGIIVGIAISILSIGLFNIIYDNALVYVLPFIAGFIGGLGYKTLKSWARLGLLHVIAWSLIMPGPISIILSYPLPFFNFNEGQLIELWITTWIIGTPLAWYAGVYFLQYIRDNMSYYQNPLSLHIKEEKDLGIYWILIGSFAIIVQVIYFLTHVPYYVDYNGYDLIFLTITTSLSTSLILLGCVLIGYGIYKALKSLYEFKPPKGWKRWALLFAFIYMLIAGVIRIGVRGYPYPPVLLDLFGIPMFAPAITIYIPEVIGMFVYPLQIIQVIASSVMAGLIVSYRVNKKVMLSSILGSIAICPSCTLSTFSSLSLSLIAYAFGFTALSSIVNTLYGQLVTSFSAQALLFIGLIYTIKASKRLNIRVKAQKLRLRS